MNRYSQQSKWGDDGSFKDFGGGDRYLVITFDNIDFAEDSAAVQAVGRV
jgi:hypothetical protein